METGKGEGGRQGVFFPCGGGGSRECGGGSSAVGLLFVGAASVGNEAGKKTGGGIEGGEKNRHADGEKKLWACTREKETIFCPFSCSPQLNQRENILAARAKLLKKRGKAMYVVCTLGNTNNATASFSSHKDFFSSRNRKA